jgi:hypothetical protein
VRESIEKKRGVLRFVAFLVDKDVFAKKKDLEQCELSAILLISRCDNSE